MATFAPTTDINMDSLTGKAGQDTYNPTGFNARITIDGDSRNDLNGGLSTGVVGSMTPSASLGGSITIDGRGSWLIPYTLGAGLVPASGTVISKGGASGKLVAVYSALNAAPTGAGGAMPVSGFIKVKQFNGTNYGTGLLTGITATASAGEKVGWIEVCGVDSTGINLSRLNQSFGGVSVPLIRGNWFDIGTTDGVRATTYQIPSNGLTQYYPGVYVDNAAPVAITNATWSSGVATFTAPAHGIKTKQVVVIEGMTPVGYNTIKHGSEPYLRVATVIDANTFTMPIAVNPGAFSVSGTCSVPEFYPTTSDPALNTAVGTDAVRGKWCWISSSGLLRFGHDGTNSSGGYIVPSGRKIRVPNVFLTCCTSATKTDNTLNATTTARYRIIPSASGAIDIDKGYGSWNTGQLNTSYSTTVTNYATMTVFGWAGGSTIRGLCINVGVGCQVSSTVTMGTFASIFNGVDFYDCVFGVGDAAAKTGFNLGTCYGVTLTRCKIIGTGVSRVGSMIYINIGADFTLTDCTVQGKILTGQWTGTNKVINLTWYSSAFGLGSPATAYIAFGLNSTSANWVIDGMSQPPGIIGQGGRAAMFDISGSSNNVWIKNIGTVDVPWDGRNSDGYVKGATWARVTTVATVTKVAHGLTVGDFVAVALSSDTETITLGVKTVTSTPTADTFTFTCLNAGATSGTLNYYFSSMTNLLTLGIGSNVIKLQNCHLLGNYTSGLTSAISNTNVQYENVTTDPKAITSLSVAANDMVMDSVVSAGTALAAITGQYGTDFVSQYLLPYNTTVSGTGLNWSRVTTTGTVTQIAHDLTNTDRFYVHTSSDITAIPVGWKTVSSLTNSPDAFIFTVLNGGATSGTLSYIVPDGRQFIFMAEGDANSTHYTIDSGTTVGFTGAGTLTAQTLGDQITWTSPKYITGNDSFAPLPPVQVGGTITNFDWTYAIDIGSGYSSFKNLSYPRAGGGGVSASTTVTMTSTTGIAVGDYVYGVGIAYLAKVVSIDSSTNITVSVANTSTVSGILIFSQLPSEPSFPTTGYKLKVRCRANVNNTDAISNIQWSTQSTNTSRSRLYPQAISVPLSIRVLDAITLLPIQNSRVYVTAAAGGVETVGTVLLTGLTDVNGYLTGTYLYSADQPITGWSRKGSVATFYQQGQIAGTITSAGFTTITTQTPDQ